MPSKAFYALDPLLHDIPDLLYQEDTEFFDPFVRFLETSVEPPFSLSVNGNWGSGKTTLMQALKKRLEQDGYPVLWFNPWEYERVGDIVFCLLRELTRVCQSDWKIGIEELKIFGLTLMTSGIDLAARMLTNNKLSYKNISELENQAREALGEDTKINPVEEVKKEFVELTTKISEKHGGLPLVLFFR